MNPENAAATTRIDDARVRAIFNTMGAGTLALVDELYAADVRFVDPFHAIEGRDALRDYYRRMYANVLSIGFDFSGQLSTPGELVLWWTMEFRHRRLRRGRPVSLEGCSRLCFATQGADSGKVSLHRDYFDAGALLYEHVPVLGGAIRFLRERV